MFLERGVFMEIKRSNTDEVISLELEGRMDKFTSPLLENEIANVIPDLQGKKLEINMKNVTYLSSAGLRVLLNTHKQLKGNFVVTNIRDEIMEIFAITGFSKVLNIE